MDPTAASIPEGLISPCMDYAAYDVLKRMPLEIGRDRADARRSHYSLMLSPPKSINPNPSTPRPTLEVPLSLAYPTPIQTQS